MTQSGPPLRGEPEQEFENVLGKPLQYPAAGAAAIPVIAIDARS